MPCGTPRGGRQPRHRRRLFRPRRGARAFEKATGVRIPYVIAPRRPGDIAVSYAEPVEGRGAAPLEGEESLEDMCRDAWRWQKNCE
jgi:UDP-glucose 4-epimerase